MRPCVLLNDHFEPYHHRCQRLQSLRLHSTEGPQSGAACYTNQTFFAGPDKWHQRVVYTLVSELAYRPTDRAYRIRVGNGLA